MNNLWKMQNFPTDCTNNPDAAAGIFIITYQKRKERESNAFITIFY